MTLTPFSVALIALICLAGIVDQWTDQGAAWWRLAAIGLVLALGYEWLQARATELLVSSNGPHTLYLGRDEQLPIRFHNASSRALKMTYAPTLPPELNTNTDQRTISITAGSTREEKLALLPEELGQYHWPTVPARTKGVLGLAWWPRHLELDATFDVGPDMAGSRRRAIGEVSAGQRAKQLGTGMDLHHLREYVPGDPLHSIDWKASARSKQLVTRIYNDDQHLEIMLVLDLGRTSRTYLDGMSQFSHYVNLCARFAEIAAAQGDSIGLVAMSDKPLVAIAPRPGTTAVTSIRHAISQLHPSVAETDLMQAGIQVQALLKRRSLIVLLTDFYGQALDGSLGQSLRLWQSRHQTVLVGLLGSDVQRIQSQVANKATDAFSTMAALEYRMNLDTNASAARRMGAHTVVARPIELQARVLEEYHLLKSQRRV
ncbi:MAG: DUF58 domain-containing protein [Pseudomonadota bacterium]